MAALKREMQKTFKEMYIIVLKQRKYIWGNVSFTFLIFLHFVLQFIFYLCLQMDVLNVREGGGWMTGEWGNEMYEA